MNVNVLGVANTLRVFAPVMLQQEKRSCLEITASSAGVMYGGLGPYGPSKQAALGIAELLYSEIEAKGAKDKVRVCALCPALVKTDLLKTNKEVADPSLSAMPTDPTKKAATQMFQ